MTVNSSLRAKGLIVLLASAFVLRWLGGRGYGAEASGDTGKTAAEKAVMLRQLAQRRAMCGPNAVYVLLRLRGVDVLFSEVESRFHAQVGTQGASMLDVRDVVRDLGVDMAVVKCSAEELDGFSTPYLLSQKAPSGDDDRIHFWVVRGIDEPGLYMLDGTSGKDVFRSHNWLADSFAGYVLVEPIGWERVLCQAAVASAALLGLVIIAVTWRIGHGRKPAAGWLRLFAGAGVLFSILCNGGYVQATGGLSERGGATQGGDDGPGIWRVRKNDGLNCLYILLRLYDSPVSYGEVRDCLDSQSGHRQCSLADLRAAAKRLGLNTQVLWCSPRELANKWPAIVHIRRRGSGSGGFVLLCAPQPDGVALIDGGTAVYQRISSDTFRRDWSGYCLVVADSHVSRRWLLVCVLPGVVASVFVGWNVFGRVVAARSRTPRWSPAREHVEERYHEDGSP